MVIASCHRGPDPKMPTQLAHLSVWRACPALHSVQIHLPGAHTLILTGNVTTMTCRNNYQCVYGVVDNLLWKGWFLGKVRMQHSGAAWYGSTTCEAIHRWANKGALMQEDFPWKSSKLCPCAGESRFYNHILLGLHPGSQLRFLGLALPFFNSPGPSSHVKVRQGGEHHLCPRKAALEMGTGQTNAP